MVGPLSVVGSLDTRHADSEATGVSCFPTTGVEGQFLA